MERVTKAKLAKMEKLAYAMAEGNTVAQSGRLAGYKDYFLTDRIYDLVQTPEFNIIWEKVMTRKRKDQEGITREWIATRLQDIASRAVKDRDRISALNSIGKIKGMEETTVRVIPTQPLVVIMPAVPVQSIPCVTTALNTGKEEPISKGETSHSG